jgi:hypothetical protein
VADPSVISRCAAKAGRQAVVVAIDARRVNDEEGGHWEIFTHGGRTATGIDAVDFAKEAEKRGAGEILLTSMDKDGTKSGYDIPLLKAVTSVVNIPVVASGGAGSVDDMPAAVLDGGASGRARRLDLPFRRSDRGRRPARAARRRGARPPVLSFIPRRRVCASASRPLPLPSGLACG